LASVAVTVMVYFPPGVPLAVVTVSVDVPELVPLMATVALLKEQLGAGVPAVPTLHARLTLPV
jgi:hypothetical protein